MNPDSLALKRPHVPSDEPCVTGAGYSHSPMNDSVSIKRTNGKAVRDVRKLQTDGSRSSR